MNRKNVLVLSLLLGLATTAGAQEKSRIKALGEKALASLTAPDKSLDSTYVYQSKFKWVVGTEGQTIHLAADLHSDITIHDFVGDHADIITGTMDTGLQNQPYWKWGLSAGYGSAHFGYGVQLGKKRSDRNSYFSFGLNSSFYGARIQYYKIHQYPVGTLALDGLSPVNLASDYMGEMRNLTLDAFYAFNRHKFVYNAVYSGRSLQRRSAGSWLISGKYLQGDFSLDDKDPIWEQLKNLQRYSTQQVSLGGGYSFNWVLLHRDPGDPKTAEGLRNLTVNATVTPMFSFYNHIQTEQNTPNGISKVRYQGQPAFSPTLQGGLCYTGGRVNVIVKAEYERFGFQGVETEVSEEKDHLRTKVKTSGVFYGLTFEATVNVRF